MQIEKAHIESFKCGLEREIARRSPSTYTRSLQIAISLNFTPGLLSARSFVQMWSFLLGQRKRIKVEPRPADKKHEVVDVERSGTEGDHEGSGGGQQQQGESDGRHEERHGGGGGGGDGSETTSGRHDREKRGSRGPSMPEIAVQRPPVPFSNGPYPEALPLSSVVGLQRQGEEGASSARAAASERENSRDQAAEGKGEEAEGGTRGESEQRNEGSRGDGEERPGGWSSVWSSLRAATSGRK